MKKIHEILITDTHRATNADLEKKQEQKSCKDA